MSVGGVSGGAGMSGMSGCNGSQHSQMTGGKGNTNVAGGQVAVGGKSQPIVSDPNLGKKVDIAV